MEKDRSTISGIAVLDLTGRKRIGTLLQLFHWIKVKMSGWNNVLDYGSLMPGFHTIHALRIVVVPAHHTLQLLLQYLFYIKVRAL
ncbi:MULTISPECIES: hypothetical protein [unclassified Sporosarcina]|uniref:hypothetical protein n=1 Tax=unclassified Sporosarcina TaxID=2647733 RepID=UPI00164CF717|nr:hypothetical protein [Sporosarcina sp. resist]QNK88966.1 hypothetical protein H7992_04365 [Sporosarcina sp. resist]